MFLCKLKISFYFASVLCMYVRYDDDVLFLYMLYNDVRHFYQRKCQVPVQRGRWGGGALRRAGRGVRGRRRCASLLLAYAQRFVVQFTVKALRRLSLWRLEGYVLSGCGCESCRAANLCLSPRFSLGVVVKIVMLQANTGNYIYRLLATACKKTFYSVWANPITSLTQ